MSNWDLAQHQDSALCDPSSLTAVSEKRGAAMLPPDKRYFTSASFHSRGVWVASSMVKVTVATFTREP